MQTYIKYAKSLLADLSIWFFNKKWIRTSKILVKLGAKFDYPDNAGNSIIELQKAIKDGNCDKVELLINNLGVDANNFGDSTRTNLYNSILAAINSEMNNNADCDNRIKIVQLLYSKGTKHYDNNPYLTRSAHYDDNPFLYAIRIGATKVISAMFYNGREIDKVFKKPGITTHEDYNKMLMGHASEIIRYNDGYINYKDDIKRQIDNFIKFKNILDDINESHGEYILHKILSMNNNGRTLFDSAMLGHNLDLEKLLALYDVNDATLGNETYEPAYMEKSFISPIYATMFLESIAKEKERKNEPVFNPIIYSFSIDDQEHLGEYLSCMYEVLLNNPEYKDDLTIIVAEKAHWSVCHLHLKTINNTPTLEMFCLDSVGLRYFFAQQSQIIEIAKKHFNKNNITVYRCPVKLQDDGSSCRGFALVLARMFYSIIYGKFSKKYDFFKHIEKYKNSINCQEDTDDNVQYVEWNDIPAKFLQTSQFNRKRSTSESAWKNEYYAYLERQLDSPVDSKGLSLKDALKNNERVFKDGVIIESLQHNLKLHKRFTVLADKLKKSNIYPTNMSLEERFKLQEEINTKFSPQGAHMRAKRKLVDI